MPLTYRDCQHLARATIDEAEETLGVTRQTPDRLTVSPDGAPHYAFTWTHEGCELAVHGQRRQIFPRVGLARQASNLARTLAATGTEALRTGRVYADEGETDRRLAICSDCEEWIPHDERCSACGCWTGKKTRLRAARCPLGKW